MDTPAEELKRFDHITILISSSIDELSRPGSLALEVIEQVNIMSCNFLNFQQKASFDHILPLQPAIGRLKLKLKD